MSKKLTISNFQDLQVNFAGELYFDNSAEHQAQKLIYSTDASVYQEKPIAVAIPKNTSDIQTLIRFANEYRVTLIPRSAGTSLAGQVVGKGIIVDISKYLNQILEVNVDERWVRVQPGVIRDDLNAYLKPYGLLFGPETSTSSRAMIGGMIGNNSCGLHSIVWGDTRTHLLEAKVLLSDGSETEFKALDRQSFYEKARLTTLEGHIYREVHRALNNPFIQESIEKAFPNKNLTRRNTGYALDMLSDNEIFQPQSAQPFNFCKLLSGSEGTLAFVTEAKINLLPLPPTESALVCIHCNSIGESLHANLIALKHRPMASELVDKYILDFTKGHHEYHKNRFFIEGDPQAILMVEFMADTQEQLSKLCEDMIKDLKEANLGYAHPIIRGADTKPAWDVRKAGLGLIRNLPGDTQPVNLIEDCAVAPEHLPAYIEELHALLEKHGLNASYYAHAGAGELHVEPMINLKTEEGKQLFRTVLAETAALVKKYDGSLSGEHGDGRLRGEFIPFMMGKEVYDLFREIKGIFDEKKIFNANKIVDTPPMNEFLRYDAGKVPNKVNTIFDFSKQESILRLAEKCSGSGDCRKTEVTGGTMCPSYMATRQEKDTTRARANILRQFLTNSTQENPFNHPEIKEVMDLCLSCKGCKAECPSQVDIAKMKAEFLQHYYDVNGISFRTKMIGSFTKSQALGMTFPRIYNFFAQNAVTSKFIKKTLGFAQERSLPTLGNITLRNWQLNRLKTQEKRQKNSIKPFNTKPSKIRKQGKVYLFCDEFTNYNDVELGKVTIKLLTALGYEVHIPEHIESGRTYLSKGMVREAQKIAIQNVKLLAKALEDQSPIIGIEPSAILTLRDEYLDLVPAEYRAEAELVADNTYLIDEFLAQEIDKKHISSDWFTKEKRLIKLHGHCHQKALSSLVPTKKLLSLPKNFEVQLIPSGCCGMAGSFGYEEEHYETSMKIGELVLFPTVRQQPEEVIIAAPGTSCRHQIKDGTGRTALHPIEILWNALNES
ncbi:FAD-linked oxidase C-terminal domain-containing protein [Flectobacillus sp. DC10W]|uniref:FAD-linked oxidase C-terminal domain-containing protein n=1 Tax=Flectobacillus longus TaxID=2984207 RepID=A0ABT6YQ35_9BACT|nr:FAD-binding and (Fe-S)-binding domain-containing protein [Flectobacillus longus]MDI9865699.1 FAD-linked oxidase C-terminal domain-containing protein [Flectobacillus longus]